MEGEIGGGGKFQFLPLGFQFPQTLPDGPPFPVVQLWQFRTKLKDRSIVSGVPFTRFDFKLSGDGVNDWLAAGINTSNLFALFCQSIPRDQWQSSGTLMVEQWAGQDVELFFGVAGGTSTNATVIIEGIRFLGVPRPIISTQMKDGQVRLQWPEAAPGYVLEVSTNLSSLTDWSSLTNVTRINGENYYTNATPDGAGYYRLKR